MHEMRSLKAAELLEYLNENKGEVIYLEDTHNNYWTLIFRKSVMGRPPKNETTPKSLQIEEDVTQEPPSQPMGFPLRDKT